jgi:hypothetical protein
VNFFPWRGGWTHAKPPTWRTWVCIRFASLYRLPSLRLWTHIQPPCDPRDGALTRYYFPGQEDL